MASYGDGRSFALNDKAQEKFLEVYEKTLCNVSLACKSVKIARQTYYYLKKNNKIFAQKLWEIEESKHDYVESKLAERIKKGDTTATIFYCKTKMKDRGYVEKTEHEFSGDKNSPLYIEEVKPDLKKLSNEQLRALAELAAKPQKDVTR